MRLDGRHGAYTQQERPCALTDAPGFVFGNGREYLDRQTVCGGVIARDELDVALMQLRRHVHASAQTIQLRDQNAAPARLARAIALRSSGRFSRPSFFAASISV